MATVAPFEQQLRLVCAACGHLVVLSARPGQRPLYFGEAVTAVRAAGLTLWYSTECCGGHQLWALDEVHLAYSLAFVTSRNRSADFPSAPGNRQLADKFPAWMVSAKHRDEVLRAINRLQAKH